MPLASVQQLEECYARIPLGPWSSTYHACHHALFCTFMTAPLCTLTHILRQDMLVQYVTDNMTKAVDHTNRTLRKAVGYEDVLHLVRKVGQVGRRSCRVG